MPLVLLVSAVFSVNPGLRGLEVAALVGGFSCTQYPPGEDGFQWVSLSWRGSLGLVSRGRLTSVLFLGPSLTGVHSETVTGQGRVVTAVGTGVCWRRGGGRSA